MSQFISHCDSPLGKMLMASDGEFLTGLWFPKGRYFAEGLFGKEIERELPVFDKTKEWLGIYFSGKDPGFLPKIKLEGSSFRKRVFELMLEIPYGKTITYGDIADRVALEKGQSSMAAQAVGGAVGRNPISIIVPCHRVMGKGGNLTGYGGGLETKLFLLKLEGIDTSGFFVPKK